MTYSICFVLGFLSAYLIFIPKLLPAKFEIKSAGGVFVVSKNGILWDSNFASIDKASAAIIGYCGEERIRKYRIVSPSGNDII